MIESTIDECPNIIEARFFGMTRSPELEAHVRSSRCAFHSLLVPFCVILALRRRRRLKVCGPQVFSRVTAAGNLRDSILISGIVVTAIALVVPFA